MYKITASAPDGFVATHRAWSMREALAWARQYPPHVADRIRITCLGIVLAARIVPQ